MQTVGTPGKIDLPTLAAQVHTAIVSDLHLGSASEIDLLGDQSIRHAFCERIAAADRLVLLGDVLELFERPQASVLASAEPVLREIGEAISGREVVIVPGNHDHRLAKQLLDRLALRGLPLCLQHLWKPSSSCERRIAAWLGACEVTFAYPGIWLRHDVYATHGHYMDCHRSLPRAECLAAALTMRALGGLPPRATPADYERVLRPAYRLGYGLAQAGLGGRTGALAARAWRRAASPAGGPSAPPMHLRVPVPGATWAANRLLGSGFQADLSAEAIYESGLHAGAELARRLELEVDHLIVGHTHWVGPAAGEDLARRRFAGTLHNAGSWVAAQVATDGSFVRASNSPGTLIWLTDGEPPECHRVLPPAGDSENRPAQHT